MQFRELKIKFQDLMTYGTCYSFIQYTEYLLKQAQSMTQLEQSPTFLALVCLSATSSSFSNFIRSVTLNCSAFGPSSCLCQPKLLSINHLFYAFTVQGRGLKNTYVSTICSSSAYDFLLVSSPSLICVKICIDQYMLVG